MQKLQGIFFILKRVLQNFQEVWKEHILKIIYFLKAIQKMQ